MGDATRRYSAKTWGKVEAEIADGARPSHVARKYGMAVSTISYHMKNAKPKRHSAKPKSRKSKMIYEDIALATAPSQLSEGGHVAIVFAPLSMVNEVIRSIK